MTARESSGPPRLWIANLDCDTIHARVDAALRGGISTRDPRWQLRRAALSRVAALGSLFGLLGSPADQLLLTGDVAPERLPAVAGCARPAAATIGKTSDGVLTMFWGGIDAAAARANDRAGWCEAGVCVPGAQVVHDLAELNAAVAEICADEAGTRRWVLKAPFGAAGRRRVLATGTGAEAKEPLAAAQRLLKLYGRGVVEPWMERVVDFGIAAQGPEGPFRFHRLLSGHDGRFLGIDLRVPDELSEAHRAELLAAAARVGARLLELGHRGRFGLDGFLVRRGDATLPVICEVNARWTFGALTRELALRVFGADDRGRLTFVAPTRADAVPLLLPGPNGPSCAWLECD